MRAWGRRRLAAVTETGMAAPIGLLVSSWFMWLFVGAWAITPSSVLTVVMDAFGIQEAAAAWIITAPQIAATLTGVPIGMSLDRVNQRHATFGASGLLLLVGLAGTATAGAGAYWLLLGTRVVGGIGLVTTWTAQTAMITRTFPTRREATAVGLFVTGYPAGYAFGQFTGPLIASALDWTATFGVYAGVGFGFGLIFWLFGAAVSTAGGSGESPSRMDLRGVLRNRGVWGVALLSLLSYMLYMIFNGWMPTYIARTFEVGLTRSGFYTALFPAIGILARPTGGLLAERLFGGRAIPVITVSLVVAGGAAAAMAFGESITALLVGLVVAGFFLQLQFGLLYTLVQRYVTLAVAGTAVAIISAVGWLGTFVGPPLVGMLIERTGTYLPVFATAVALAIGGTLTLYVISEPSPD